MRVQGDKKEPHDSLLDAPVPARDEDLTHSIAAAADTCTDSRNNVSSSGRGADFTTKQEPMEYTYDKAIEDYKQYAENSVKKRTSSMTNLASNSSEISSRCGDNHKYSSSVNLSSPPVVTPKIGNKCEFFVKEMDKDFTKPSPKPALVIREKSPKVDISKRRTMFEINQSKTVDLAGKLDTQRSKDMTASAGNLRAKVASFTNIDTAENTRRQGAAPPRDGKFKEKLTNFSTKAADDGSPLQRKPSVTDKNFHQKLAAFTNLESAKNRSDFSARRASAPPINKSTLKSKIASFEQLDQPDDSADFHYSTDADTAIEKSMSMECLSRPPVSTSSGRRLSEVNDSSVVLKQQSLSTGDLVVATLYGGTQATPYIEVHLQTEDLGCSQGTGGVVLRDHSGCASSENRRTVYETVDSCHLVRDVAASHMFSIFQTVTCGASDGGVVAESAVQKRLVDEVCHDISVCVACRIPCVLQFQTRRTIESF